MKPIFYLFMLFSFTLFGQNSPKWMRHSSISPDGKEIAFTYKGDIYKVNATGGNAHQLTFHTAHDYEVVWSKDGSKLAFSSNRYGNFDVFVMNSNGGNATE
jgi:Tol biopolymer transport system component